jgi:hypothetical protein
MESLHEVTVHCYVGVKWLSHALSPPVPNSSSNK